MPRWRTNPYPLVLGRIAFHTISTGYESWGSKLRREYRRIMTDTYRWYISINDINQVESLFSRNFFRRCVPEGVFPPRCESTGVVLWTMNECRPFVVSEPPWMWTTSSLYTPLYSMGEYQPTLPSFASRECGWWMVKNHRLHRDGKHIQLLREGWGTNPRTW